MASVSMAARDSFLDTTDFAGEEPCKIARGPQRPFAGHPHQVHPARGIFVLQLLQQCVHVDAGRQARDQGLFVERLLGGEQQRLENAQLVGARLRLASDDFALVLFDAADDHTHLRNICHRLASLVRLPV